MSEGIRVKLLTGEILVLDSDDVGKSVDDIREEVSIHIETDIEKVVIMPTEDPQEFCAVVIPHPLIVLEQPDDFDPKTEPCEWMSTCNNVTMLEWCLDVCDPSHNRYLKNSSFSTHYDEVFERLRYESLVKNPHPIVVKYFMERLMRYTPSEESSDVLYSMNENPSDEILDYFFKHPEQVRLDFLVYNTNPRVVDLIQMVLDRYPSIERNAEWERLFQLGTPSAIDLALSMLDDDNENMKHMVTRFAKRLNPHPYGRELLQKWNIQKITFATEEETERFISYISQLNIDMFMPSEVYDLFPQFLMSHHTSAIQWIISNLKSLQSTKFFTKCVCRNDNDRVVQALLKFIRFSESSALLLNPHPLAVKRCIKWLRSEVNRDTLPSFDILQQSALLSKEMAEFLLTFAPLQNSFTFVEKLSMASKWCDLCIKIVKE